MFCTGLTIVLLIWTGHVYCALESKPNIILILTDDGGYGDMGFNGSPDIESPFINSLAEDGLILKRHYTNTVCTPSRAELMTGRHAIANGIQSDIFEPWTFNCLNSSEVLLPELIKSNGYATHMIGKWHLGYAGWACFPCNRGFDTYMGLITGIGTYEEHTNYDYYDFISCGTDSLGEFRWENLDNYDGTHSSVAFMERAEEVITNHDVSRPMFLYFPMQLVHEPYDVTEATQEYYNRALDRELDSMRAEMQAMVYYLDDMVKNLTQLLESKGMMDDTILIFINDNGGPPGALNKGISSNLNLRGGKRQFYEGGIRTYGFIHSKKHLKHKGETNSYVHIMDWFSTLISFSGGWDSWLEMGRPILYGLDAVDQSDFLLNGGEAPRTEFLVHIDSVVGSAAYIENDWKLILGPPILGSSCSATAALSMDSINTDIVALYNITGDPSEDTNLAEMYPDVVARLTEKIASYIEEETALQCTSGSCEGDYDYCYPTDTRPYFNAFDCCGLYP